MIERDLARAVRERLLEMPAVALLGPRQVGKTTLARALADTFPHSVYLDLESPRDALRFSDPEAYLDQHRDELVVIDEVHRAPGLFPILRGIIDADRRRGKRTGRFLLLGSASLDLLRQSSESLAGRIAYLDLTPLRASEIDPHVDAQQRLWLRGGFPDSYLARNDAASFAWRENFITTYLERDIPEFGGRIPSTTLRRLWMMLANDQGATLNASRIATALGVSNVGVSRYLDLLCDVFLVRRLNPWLSNVGKRLVRAPKIYVRDSGVTHALLNLVTIDDILGHSVAGGSWEGFVIDNVLAALPPASDAGFYRTAGGAEIDLVLSIPPKNLWAIEIKRSRSTPPAKGFYIACNDLQPTARYVVYPIDEQFPLSNGVVATGVLALIDDIRKLLKAA